MCTRGVYSESHDSPGDFWHKNVQKGTQAVFRSSTAQDMLDRLTLKPNPQDQY